MKPIIMGIAGGSASGKSTVASGLVDSLGDRCLLLLHDRYYRSLPAELHESPLSFNFDHPTSLDTERMVEDLRQLSSGFAVRAPRYDYARHAREEQTDLLDPRPVIVVEGILVLADEPLRELMDYKIYVNTPDDIRLARRIRRDMRLRGRGIDEILARYESTVRPMHVRHVEPTRSYADLVLDGTRNIEALVAALLALPGVSAPPAP